MVSPHLLTDMSKYCQRLKDKYKLLPLCSPEELLECKSSRYVSLSLEKFDKNSNTLQKELVSGQLNNIIMKRVSSKSLTLANILNVKEEKNKVVLIEGGPGMGKSTLAIKICKCWAYGELLEEYDAVILLPLRDPEIQAANNIGDLLLIENKNERELLYDEITASQGDKICFILEGYDELPEDLRNTPVFTKLTERLPKCSIIYTSRPEACNQLRQVASQKIEILGFEKEQIDEYIDNAFENVEDGKEKARKLRARVNDNPLVRSILYVPINVAIICHLFLLALTLPSTLTELYTLLCLNIILRHINRYSSKLKKVDYLNSLYELPVEINEQFHKLCFIAYRGREEDKLIFSSRELESFGIGTSELSGFGLLLIAPYTSVYGREKSYNFLHLTVQEFCSSFYISTLSDQEQYECFKKYQFYDRFRMIWRFYSGITKLRNTNILYLMLPSKCVESEYRKRRTLELLCCAYEAQNYEVCHVIGNHIDLSYCDVDKISCSALCYQMKQYRGTMKLIDLCYCHIGDEGCNMLLNLLSSHHSNTGSLDSQLNLYSNNITYESSQCIASLLSSEYPVTKLDVGWNKLCSSTDIIFKSLHHNTVLTELSLQFTSLTSSDMQSLVQMLTSNDTLSMLDISNNDIGLDDGCQYLADCRNISLKKLKIFGCRLGVSGVDKIGKMLCYNKSIAYIDLGRNSIGDDGVEKLVEHLKYNKTIKHLDLWSNMITSNGASHLRKLFSLNYTNVNSIELSNNPLKDQGVDCILQSITINMEFVGLCDTRMTSSCCSVSTALNKIKFIRFTPPDNFDVITSSLADTTVLKQLDLRDGSDTAYDTMISGISRNNSIKKLTFCYGHFDHQTMINLVQAMKFNKSITELVMRNVNVSPSEYSLLADVLPVNDAIKNISICPSDKKGLDQSLVLHFLKQLKNNYTMELLTLGVTTEAQDDKKFIRDVEISVEDMNIVRQSQGVTTPLLVKLYCSEV